MKFIKNAIILIFLAVFCAIAAAAQSAAPSPSTTTINEDLQQRLTQMEAEMKLMREELARLKLSASANRPTVETVKDAAVPTIIAVKAETKNETKIET
jgi:type II secretory pathway component PulK